jgi:hypothetical protein
MTWSEVYAELDAIATREDDDKPTPEAIARARQWCDNCVFHSTYPPDRVVVVDKIRAIRFEWEDPRLYYEAVFMRDGGINVYGTPLLVKEPK